MLISNRKTYKNIKLTGKIRILYCCNCDREITYKSGADVTKGIYKTFHPTAVEYTIFCSTQGVFYKMLVRKRIDKNAE